MFSFGVVKGAALALGGFVVHGHHAVINLVALEWLPFNG
jgi:hypothetical protein